MAYLYPNGVNTDEERAAYGERVLQRWIHLFNVIGRWSKYDSTKWYIVNGRIDAGNGWNDSNLYHVEIVEEYPDQVTADIALIDMGSPANHSVVNPGMTSFEHATLPATVQARYPFTNKLDKVSWQDFRDRMDVARHSNNDELQKEKKKVKDKKTFNPDPTEGTGAF